MNRLLHLLVVLALASGCALDVPRIEDPTLDGLPVGGGLQQVSRAEWEAAEAGCEDAPFAELHLVGCEGEPSLGALVDLEGDVVCVDALSVLRDELHRPAAEPLAADPSPQPSHPGPMGFAARVPVVGSARPGATRPDPTPTPIVEEDPTPTPVTPNFVDRFVPQMERRGAEEDPTPTPTTED